MNDRNISQSKETKGVFWNYLFVFTGRLGSTFLSGVILALVARNLMPEGYGRFSLFLMVANFISIVFLNWQNSAVVRYGKEMYISRGNIGEVLGSVFAVLSVTFPLSLLAIVIFRKYIGSYIGYGIEMFFFLAFFAIVSALYDLSFYVLQSVGRMKVYGFLPTIEKLVVVILLFAVLNIASLSLKSAIAIYLAGEVVVVAITFLFIDKKYILPLHSSITQIRKVFGYAWPMLVGAVFSFFLNWVDIMFIKKYFQVADVGVYSLAYRGMTFFLMLTMSTISLTVPMIVSFRTLHQPNLVKMYIDEFIPQGVLFFSIVLSLVISISDPFITLVFGRSYESAVMPFVILLSGVAFNAIGCFYTGVTAAYDIILKVVMITIFMSIIKIAGMFLLVTKYGLTGAAVASFFALALGNLLYIPVTNAAGDFIAGKNNIRYLVGIWALPPVINLAGYFMRFDFYMRLVLFAIVTIIFIILARRSGLFKARTLEIIDYIDMPEIMKKNIKWIYSAFLISGYKTN